MKTFVAFLVLTVSAAAQTHTSSQHPGSELYTPTKQEWLLLCLVQDKTTWDSANSGEVQFTFSADDDPDTIDVNVYYAKSAAKETVDDAFVYATSRIQDHAMHYGWNWVKIRKSEMKMPEIKAPH
jgi:hypothetical protein